LVINTFGRIILLTGEVKPFTITFTPTSDRSGSGVAQQLPDGWLLNVMAAFSGVAIRRGQCFANVGIQRPSGSTTLLFGSLIRDYLVQGAPPSWPEGPLLMPTDGAGFLRSITGTVPAAGAEITEVVPTGARWRLYGMRFSLTTAVAVANRLTNVVIDNGAAPTDGQFPANAVQAASLTVAYTGGQLGAVSNPAGADAIILLPAPIPLFAGWRWRTITANIQAADQYTAPTYLVEEWIEP
jgi:hypothetical protein